MKKIKELFLMAGVTLASLSSIEAPPRPKTRNDYVRGPSKDVRKKRKAVKKARRRNRK